MKKTLFSLLLILTTLAAQAEIRYVFYLIGDGMGCNQVLTAGMYQAELQGRIGLNALQMQRLPYTGLTTTYSFTNGITDSAAAGTALATGNKTRNGMLGMTPDTAAVYSVATQLHQQGWPVGILTTVPIDDATPAAFYAHVPNRHNYYDIGTDLARSGFEFFGGAGFRTPVNKSGWNSPNLYDLCEQNGYTIAHGYADAQTKLQAERLLMVQEHDGVDREKGAEALPYAIDRREGDLTLEQLTETAIRYLAPKSRFFLMIEGGMIDWAGHSRDGATNVQETLDFDRSVRLAYQFYEQHPDETLIVITADHETGGLALGNKDYTLNLQLLQHQHMSAWKLNNRLKQLREDKQLTWDNVQTLLRENFGLYDQVEVTKQEDKELRKAFRLLASGNGRERYILYNRNSSKLGTAAVALVNRKAKLGWTTYAHSGAPVPVFAAGPGAECFVGFYDNTDIMPRILHLIATQP
ncbi:MAG: alkaline phosphatase [Paludibacteraceae bacterium]|nr:alkaline phosphatase [Paludibacteraceae bacterium]